MSEERKKPRWEGRHYSFFQNRECEYFPCHAGADPARFNCLFCYCPLYMLGPDCGGNFRYTPKGIKDCTGCLIPHLPENYGRITGKYAEIAAKMRKDQPPAPEKECSTPQSGPAPSENANNPETEKSRLSASVTPHSIQAFSENVENTAPEKDKPSAPVCSHSGSAPAEKVHAPASASGSAFSGEGSVSSLKASFSRVVMLACTERGFETMGRAAAALSDRLPGAEILQTGHCAHVPGYEKGPKLSAVTEQYFREADALVFFTAAGIAVRCIAPFVRDKFRDPAVLVADENGRVVISLLSGHAGGANRLSLALASALGAQPVITTATDGRGLFAVDVFAAENELAISDRTIAKLISARLLAGEEIRIWLEADFDGKPANILTNVEEKTETAEQRPAAAASSGKTAAEASRELTETEPQPMDSEAQRELPMTEPQPMASEAKADGAETFGARLREALRQYGGGVCLAEERNEADVVISCRRRPGDRGDALYLIPHTVTLGIGCRRGSAQEAIQKAAAQLLERAGVFRESLCGVASIDLKQDEQGLLDFARAWELPITFYSAEELGRVPGTFSGSDFVRSVTGVDCVCERSAVRLALDEAAPQDGSSVRLVPDKAAAQDGLSVRLALDELTPQDGTAEETAPPDSGSGAALLLERKQSLGGVTAALALRL